MDEEADVASLSFPFEPYSRFNHKPTNFPKPRSRLLRRVGRGSDANVSGAVLFGKAGSPHKNLKLGSCWRNSAASRLTGCT